MRPRRIHQKKAASFSLPPPLTNLNLQAFKSPLLADENECRYVYIEYEKQDHAPLAAPDAIPRSIPFVPENQRPWVTAMRPDPLRSTTADVDAKRKELHEMAYNIEVIPSCRCREGVPAAGRGDGERPTVALRSERASKRSAHAAISH